MAFKKSFFKKNLLKTLLFSGFLIVNIFNAEKSSAKTQDNIDIPKVVSYRSASCGCCKKWVNHLRQNGLEVVDNILEDVSGIKNQYKIPNNLRSCHSAKIGTYAIEGHVPIESITKLFKEKPIISGIAVPGMPLGSPGMEINSHDSHSHDYEEYNVVSFSKNGKIKKFDEIVIDKYAESDIKQIVFGTYNPLDRFMSLKEIKSVLNKNKLLDGSVWTLPIVLPVNKRFGINKNYNLINSKKKILCSIKVDSFFKIDSEELMKEWFSTNDLSHPGIKSLIQRGRYFISGKISRPQYKNFIFQKFEVTPKKSKELIYIKGWNTVIGFHTRNIPHQGHIFIQKKSIKYANADGLMLSPAVGQKKKGDFKNEMLIESYSEVLRSKTHYNKAILCCLDIYSRYAGAREAVFTAICRKNLGCSHFIVGRDHTGYNNNSSDKDLRKFFSELGDLGIEIIFFDKLGFNSRTKRYTFTQNTKNIISGSIVRSLIKQKKKIPNYLLDKYQQQIIKKWKKKFFYD